jgi:hypothetical protein
VAQQAARAIASFRVPSPIQRNRESALGDRPILDRSNRKNLDGLAIENAGETGDCRPVRKPHAPSLKLDYVLPRQSGCVRHVDLT